MSDDPRLDHRPHCTGPDVVSWRGQRGDPMLSCRACRAVRNVAHLEPDPEPVAVEPAHTTTTPDPRLPRLPIGVFYVCREHQDQPVTWRGKGCRECERERDERRNKRKRPATPEPEPSW